MPVPPEDEEILGPPGDPETVARTICLQLLDRRARTRSELAEALHRGLAPPAGAVAAVNRVLSRSIGRHQLTRVSGTWQLRFAPARPLAALEAVARSAAQTLADSVVRVRCCAGATCSLFFLDATPTLQELDLDTMQQAIDTLAGDLRLAPADVRGALDGMTRVAQVVASRSDQLDGLLSATRSVTDTLVDQQDQIVSLADDADVVMRMIWQGRCWRMTRSPMRMWWQGMVKVEAEGVWTERTGGPRRRPRHHAAAPTSAGRQTGQRRAGRCGT